MVPSHLVEADQSIELEMVVDSPVGDGPFPLVIFNHGSTGSGRNKNRFKQTVDAPPVANFFTARGWMVICPQRRGRGRSGGLYDEGFGKNRVAYSCVPDESLAGVKRACEDLDVTMEYVLTRPDVDPSRIIIAGVSRGAILAIAYAGLQPEKFIAAINFSGGWLGRACARTYQSINEQVFVSGAGFKKPTLWLHGKTDSYYRVSHCRENFEAYCAAGGTGQFLAFAAGHNLLYKPEHWQSAVDQFLRDLD